MEWNTQFSSFHHHKLLLQNTVKSQVNPSALNLDLQLGFNLAFKRLKLVDCLPNQQQIPHYFIKPKCSQNPTTGPYPKLTLFTTYVCVIPMVSSFWVPGYNFACFSQLYIHAVCHTMLINLITLTSGDEQQKQNSFLMLL